MFHIQKSSVSDRALVYMSLALPLGKDDDNGLAHSRSEFCMGWSSV